MKNLIKQFIKNQKGLTLLECAVLLIIGSIILVTAVGSYIQFLKVSTRQQRVMAVERSLTALQVSLQQSLITLPGRGLGTSSGITFGNPLLPAAGSMPDSKGKTTPIRLSVVTPYKYNGQDAFTVAYADSKAPCLVLSDPSVSSNGTGTAKVALPLLVPIKPPITPHGGGGIGINPGDIVPNINATAGNETNIVTKPTSTPTPNPSPTVTPDPTPVPPNVNFNTTLLGLPWIPSVDSFKVGDLMLIVVPPIYDDTDSKVTVTTESRLVRILSVTPPSNPTPGTRQFIQITYDLCLSGECGQQLPGLTNVPTSPIKFTTGAIIVPLRLSSFYFKQDQMSHRLVRNDGGVFLPDGNGGFNIQGGQETILGETDNFTVTYRLKDGTIQPTPVSPLVPWLTDITSVDISILREIPSTRNNELLSRKLTLNFPITIRNFD